MIIRRILFSESRTRSLRVDSILFDQLNFPAVAIGFLKWTKVSNARGQNSLARMQREKLLASSQPLLTVHAFVHYATDRDLSWKFYRACVIFLAASIGMLRTCASEERISVSFSPCTRRISSFVARAVQTISRFILKREKPMRLKFYRYMDFIFG